jgi:hypothetical protein
MTNEQEYPGWICPKCKWEEVIITATANVRVTIDGCDLADDNSGGYEWDDDSRAYCPECDWEGTANDCAQAAEKLANT